MRSAEFIISDPAGIHARPAGYLVKEAEKYRSEIRISCRDKSASAGRLFALMKLGAKQGDTLTVSAEGEDEDAALAAVLSFMKEHF